MLNSKKMRILLVSPNIKGMKDVVTRIMPRLGIGYIASVLREEGHEVFIRDTALEGYETQKLLPDGDIVLIGETDEQISKYIQCIQPDIVGISIFLTNISDSAKNIARIVKSVKPDTYVVVGGNHVTNTAKDYYYAQNNKASSVREALEDPFIHIINDKNIDYAMVGEADYEFAKLVDCLSNNKEICNINNLIYQDDNSKIVFNSVPLTMDDKRIDISNLPILAYDLLNMDKYFQIGTGVSMRRNSEKILTIMATRGCPEQCAYCTTPDTWGKIVRWRNPKVVGQEIRNVIQRYGKIDEIQILDDNITVDLNKLYELCEELEKVGIPWCLANGTKANYHVSKQFEYYKRMKDAGCYQITIACETGNQNIMDNILNKKLKLYEINNAVENAKGAGLFVHTYWIIGLPGETRDEMEKSVVFAASIGADSYSLSIFNPLPGTPLYRKVIENNLFWPNAQILDNLTVRKSLIKVDGFGDPHEFENWVDIQLNRLNGLLEKKDPQRFAEYEKNKNPKLIEGKLKWI